VRDELEFDFESEPPESCCVGVSPASFAAFASAKAERERQDKKWGVQHHDLAWWTVILGEEYGEACKAIYEYMALHGTGGIEEVRDELVQVAVVALAAIEDIDQALAGGNGRALIGRTQVKEEDHDVQRTVEEKQHVVEWGD
jgi:hypothetical protein